MPDHSHDAAAEVLKACAHPTRLAILRELAAGPKCVTDMEELLPARQANISQHLAVLRHAQLVDFAQDGTLRCYYLARPKLVQDLFALMAREETIVERSAEEVRRDKARLEAVRASAATRRPARHGKPAR